MAIKATKKPTAFGDIYRYPFTRSYHGRRNDILTFNAASTKFTSRHSSNEIRRSAERLDRVHPLRIIGLPVKKSRISQTELSTYVAWATYVVLSLVLCHVLILSPSRCTVSNIRCNLLSFSLSFSAIGDL